MHVRPVVTVLIAFALVACQRTAEPPAAPVAQPAAVSTQGDDLVARGEYIVRIAGCNDCHTAGYGARGGEVPMGEWLKGSPDGFHGPWGTTFGTNLRLTAARLDEADWLTYTANLEVRPLMPDYMLRAMREEDRRAIWHFIRSLGEPGEPAPAALPPGQTPTPPYLELVLPGPPAAPPAADQNGQNRET